MDAKEVTIRCPCCDSRVVVDVRTAQVLTWSRVVETDSTGRPKVTEEDWDQAAQRAQGRLGGGLDKFEKGLKREQDREKDLDDLWRKMGDEG